METVNIAPDPDGMRAWLGVVARDPDPSRALWGLRMARAMGDGWAEWYADEIEAAAAGRVGWAIQEVDEDA